MLERLRNERLPTSAARNDIPGVRVSNIRAASGHGTYRVTAEVDGVPLWYESDDIQLCVSPEAFLTALLIPGLHDNRRVILEAPVSETWLSNIEQLLEIWHKWWAYPKLFPQAETHPDASSLPRRATALCFSGGVDSFYSLLHCKQKPDFLVTVHGFDIPLLNETRMSAFKSTLHTVADAFGAKPIIIRTNFREHPTGDAAPWLRAHGGALAAVGHLLSNSVEQLTISATFGYRFWQPSGSTFQTDHLWSSDRVRVLHYGAESLRHERVRFLAREPLARKHLRVCWENRVPHGNCSRCEKCLITMLLLSECGVLDDFSVFDGEKVLTERIDALPYLRTFIFTTDGIVQRGQLRPALARSARAVLKRSQRMLRNQRIRSYASRFRNVLFYHSGAR
jgi:hypothetical protein